MASPADLADEGSGEIVERPGYEQPSAFVAGFRKAFGITPSRYFDGND